MVPVSCMSGVLSQIRHGKNGMHDMNWETYHKRDVCRKQLSVDCYPEGSMNSWPGSSATVLCRWV